MTTRLCQVIAIEGDARERAQVTYSTARAALAKEALLSGITRVYQPLNDGGIVYPPERTKVQLTVDDVTRRLREDVSRLWDITATKDWANTDAYANVVLDGEVVIEGAPSTYLVWLEKQLDTLRAYFVALPTLDPAEIWTDDQATGVMRTEPTQGIKNRKVPKAHILYEATDRHPAQVQPYNVDEPEGTWTTTKFSGAIYETRRRQLISRVDRLREAVKFAREEANQQPVTDVNVGSVLFDLLLAP
jgi:hypothetical protein